MRQSLRGHPQALENVEVNTPYEIQNRADIAIFVEEAPIDAPPADGDGADLVPAGGRIRKRRSPSTQIWLWTQQQIDTGWVVYSEAV